ncbi:MAG: penicillin acylase family protein, partial [Candidatus Marinimicrobia bacterium]|nr:penicillin acylase family protein [Candidatus Neomarinimicrobiota bacterium]
PLLASDPHLEINRLPPLWYEMHYDLDGNWVKGATLPGVPVVIFGRSRHVSWGNTYGFMDMIDWYMEECHDGQYKVDGKWREFEKRVEIINTIGREPEEHVFYENHHGVLEGDPTEPGIYLTMAYSGRDNVGSEILNTLFTAEEIRTVDQAMQEFRKLSIPTFNWLFADSKGNTGYQMCGRMPKRHTSLSGLLPVKGWKSEYDWDGMVDSAKLPALYNPPAGFFATANSDMNHYGTANPINLPMAPYRRQRITELLKESDTVDHEYCKQMHFDTYSKQAELFMPHIEPYLPDTPNGDILKEWDFCYDLDSKGAYLFESVYECLLDKFFGSHGFGRDTVDYLNDYTAIFTNYYGNFDSVMLDESSDWLEGVDYEEVFQQAVIEGLDAEAKAYKSSVTFRMNNIFVGENLPGFLGFDETGVQIAGGRATIPQLQFFRIFGNDTVVGQSYRIIADMSEDSISTTIPGGPSGKRFSRWYRSDLNAWIQGDYKIY